MLIFKLNQQVGSTVASSPYFILY